jgi:hypothetical protein
MEVRHTHVLTALQILGVGALVWVLVTWKTPWNTMRYIGAALAVVGVSLVGVARFQLGKSFAVNPS